VSSHKAEFPMAPAWTHRKTTARNFPAVRLLSLVHQRRFARGRPTSPDSRPATEEEGLLLYGSGGQTLRRTMDVWGSVSTAAAEWGADGLSVIGSLGAREGQPGTSRRCADFSSLALGPGRRTRPFQGAWAAPGGGDDAIICSKNPIHSPDETDGGVELLSVHAANYRSHRGDRINPFIPRRRSPELGPALFRHRVARARTRAADLAKPARSLPCWNM